MTQSSSHDRTGFSRRQALARLGLGAAAAYTAPTVLHLDRSANAVQPSCTGKGKGKGNPWCTGSGSGGSSSKGKGH